MEPIVNGLIAELDGKVALVKVDIQSQAGRQLSGVYGYRETPTFILFGEDGKEIWRSIGTLDVEEIRELIP